LIEDLGLSRIEVAAHLRGKNSRKRVAPKYRSPDDVEQTWSGRGRKPRWFLDQIGAGKTPEDMAI
jgi:DNA-binding protein H-NS